MDGICKCGKFYDVCKYPLSHGHPTIDAVEVEDDDQVTEVRFPGAWSEVHGRPKYELDRPRFRTADEQIRDSESARQLYNQFVRDARRA